MLRALYFVGALLSAFISVVSTLGGFIYIIHAITVRGLSLEHAMSGGSAITALASTLAIVGWIIFSYLFVVEDDRIENLSGNTP